MNTRTLYLAIGELDDDLILEAAEPVAKPHPAYRRWAALAACFCLFIAAVLFHTGRDQVYFNALTPPPPVGFKVQGEAELLDYQAAMDYYGVTLPNALAGLPRQARDLFVVYRLADGTVTWDENWIGYQSGDRSVTVTLSKAPLSFPESADGGKPSRIAGTSVVLAASDSNYCAQWEQNGVNLRVLSQGLDQNEFLSVIRTILRGG